MVDGTDLVRRTGCAGRDPQAHRQGGAAHQRLGYSADGVGAGRASFLYMVACIARKIFRELAGVVRRACPWPGRPEHPDGRGRGRGVSCALEAGGSPCPDRNPYVVAGAVAGLAAAFGAPAAGVLFAFEEMKSRRDTSLIVAACASAIGAHLMIRIVFGMGRILPFAGFEAPPLSSFWIVALEGAVFGVLGVGYNKTLLWLHDREAGQTLIPDRWRALPPLLLAGCLALFAPLLIGGGESLIIFVGEHDVALKTLILLLAFKYLFAQYSTVASIPGGLLMPILCLGALWGRLWAELPVSALAAHGLASGSVQPYVLFGMVSYFAATVRAPLTGIVLVTEMSGTYTCLPGSLLAGLIACKVANLLHCPPVYDSLKERIRL